MVWLAGWAKPLSRMHLCHYEEWHEGQPLKLLLVGYNGARNTGADARVVALVRQLEEALGCDNTELTVMTLDNDSLDGYFPAGVRQWKFSTVFFWSLLRACCCHHAAILCEGSTLTTTFAEALSVFYCQAAGIMQRQGKPCIAYGSEVGHLDGWIARLAREMCRDTYFMVRTHESLKNLKNLGLKGHVGTDTAWPFQTAQGESWAHEQLMSDGWDGVKPLLGVAVINPFWWPVRPSLWRWAVTMLTGHHERQYDKMYFYSDSEELQHRFQHYLSQMAEAVNRYQKEHDAYVVILGMEKLDAESCLLLGQMLEGPHAVYHSGNHNVFQMTGLLRQLSLLLTSRYHAAVLSMARAIPLVAVSMDARLDGLMEEAGLADGYLYHVDEHELGKWITSAFRRADEHRDEIASTLLSHQVNSENKVHEMSQFFVSWLKKHFS